MTYQEKLYTNLMKLEPNQWYSIVGRSDYEKLVSTIKQLIHEDHNFTFSEDYTKIRRETIEPSRLPSWREAVKGDPRYKVETVEKGTTEHFSVVVGKKGQQNFSHTFEKTHYRIYRDGVLIAIE